MNEDEAGDMTKQILVEFKSSDDEVLLERQLLTLHKATWCVFEPRCLGVEVRCIRKCAKYTSAQVCSSFPWVAGSFADRTHVGPVWALHMYMA